MKRLFLIAFCAFGLLNAQTDNETDPNTFATTFKGNYSGKHLYTVSDSIPDIYSPVHNDSTMFIIKTQVLGYTGLDSNHVSTSKNYYVMANKNGYVYSVPSPLNIGNTTLASTLLQTAFVVTHGLGYTPTSVVVQPRSSSAAGAHYVSSITSTTFTITYLLNIGVSNLTWDWVAYQ